jgi:hypothetical protein
MDNQQVINGLGGMKAGFCCQQISMLTNQSEQAKKKRRCNMVNDQLFARSNQATTPVNACRIPIFSPTRRPKSVSSWRVETPWGWAIITGRLGQQHRDLLDAARMVADAEQWTTDGKMHLKIDLARLRGALGGDAVNNQRIKDWLEDLRVAQVVVYIKDKNINITGGIISEVLSSIDNTVLNGRPGTFKSERGYMHIEFSSGWSKLIETDRAMRYPLQQVVGLQHGFSQAVARFCLSHSHVNDDVAGLMDKVAAIGRIRDRQADLEDDQAALAAIGIEISEGRIKSGERRQSPVKREQSPVTREQSPVSASKVR